MKTRQQFIIDTLKPYILDPNICGIDDYGQCVYLTKDGRRCAVGKHLRPKFLKGMSLDDFIYLGPADTLLEEYEEEELFVKRVRDIGLDGFDWTNIQMVHDLIARKAIEDRIVVGGVFREEVEKYINRLEEDLNVDLSELKELL